MSKPSEFSVDLDLPEIAEIIASNNLLTKRMVKYDVIDGVMYLMIWTEKALAERKKIQKSKYKETYVSQKEEILLKAKLRYRKSHPDAKDYEKKSEEKLPYYLNKKLKQKSFQISNETTAIICGEK